MAEEERIRKEAEARANLELLEVLESKKNELLQQLEDAKARALEANISILSPPEIDLKDVEALAAVPQDARDEMDTLVREPLFKSESNQLQYLIAGSSGWSNRRFRG